MLFVLDGENRIHAFPTGRWIKPPVLCPAPCCDIACAQCAPDADCPHSLHGEQGRCVFHYEAAADGFICDAHFVTIRATSDCLHDAPDCACVAALRAAQDTGRAGVRPAGRKRAHFLDRLPAPSVGGPVPPAAHEED